MAVTLQAGSHVYIAGTTPGASPYAQNLTVNVANANSLLMVLVTSGNKNFADFPTFDFNGTRMSLLFESGDFSGGQRHVIAYVKNPAVGSGTVSVGISGGWLNTQTVQAFVVEGADLTNTFSAVGVDGNGGWDSPPHTIAVTSTAADMLVVSLGAKGATADNLTFSTGETPFSAQIVEDSTGSRVVTRTAYKLGAATTTTATNTGDAAPTVQGQYVAFVIKGTGGGGGTTVTSVAVAPASPSVPGGTTQQFTATVVGTGSPAQTVTWSASAGTINASGLFTAPAGTGVAQTITVTATSTVDSSKSGTATVTVPAAYSQYPSPAQVQAGVVYGNTGQYTGTLVAGSGGGGGIGIMIGGVGITQSGDLVIGVK